MQNVIAIIGDFEKTLINGYMQSPIFEDYHVDEKQFWDWIDSSERSEKLYWKKAIVDTCFPPCCSTLCLHLFVEHAKVKLVYRI